MNLFSWVRSWRRDSTEILLFLSRLEENMENFMVDVNQELSDIKGQLDTVNTNVGAIATRLQAQSDQIAKLTAELAGAGTLTPEQQMALDAIKTEADALAVTTAGMVPAPATPI